MPHRTSHRISRTRNDYERKMNYDWPYESLENNHKKTRTKHQGN